MKRFLTIVLLVVGFSGYGGTTIPYYGVTMNQKLLSNGVSTECNYNPSQATATVFAYNTNCDTSCFGDCCTTTCHGPDGTCTCQTCCFDDSMCHTNCYGPGCE